MFIWPAFIICTSVIFYSGTKLAKYGDIIAEKTGLGRAWIGLVLMASVTSLPELVTGISSVTFAGVPDIAAGDVLGSCAFNILLLALLDASHHKQPLSIRAHHGHTLSASFGIFLLAKVVISLFLGDRIPAVGWIGLYTPLIIVIYLIAIRSIYFYEKKQMSALIKEAAVELQYEGITTRTAVVQCVINAAVVVISAIFLPKIGEAIAETTGLGQTFVGNIFIAVSTSFPEVVVSIAAVKIGAIDLGVGNLFGSNIFSILILAIDDLFFIKGPILSFVNQSHVIPGLSAITMTSIAIIGLTYRAENKNLVLAWDSAGIVLMFIINLILLYFLK
jgi:cation:H+ antiporter